MSNLKIMAVVLPRNAFENVDFIVLFPKMHREEILRRNSTDKLFCSPHVFFTKPRIYWKHGKIKMIHVFGKQFQFAKVIVFEDKSPLLWKLLLSNASY